MISQTGWSWEYVEHHMDLHRYAAFQRHWRRFPPLQRMVQGYLGIEPASDPEDPSEQLPPQDEEAAIADFMRNFAAAGGAVH